MPVCLAIGTSPVVRAVLPVGVTLRGLLESAVISLTASATVSRRGVAGTAVSVRTFTGVTPKSSVQPVTVMGRGQLTCSVTAGPDSVCV